MLCGALDRGIVFVGGASLVVVIALEKTIKEKVANFFLLAFVLSIIAKNSIMYAKDPISRKL